MLPHVVLKFNSSMYFPMCSPMTSSEKKLLTG